MIDLWEEKIPYNDSSCDFTPTIKAYPAQSAGAVVLFAGGGYGMKADHEGPVMAEWLQSIGITTFLVDYRVAPYKHPAQISDAVRAVRTARFYAEKFGYSRDKIAVMGFSAGAHLACSVAVHYDKEMYVPTDRVDEENCRPDATILGYPVIDMGNYRHDGSRQNLLGEHPTERETELMSLHLQVTPDTPEAFIWHTSTDQAVPVMNSLLYTQALARENIPFELHIYPLGSHGLGLAPAYPHIARWKDDLNDWFKLKGWK